ncbi:helix-turn-helix domain-containing protein [Amycolatopsis thermoflava]|uniref:helix-turn-helix domain-containing protein n=1 Tax=Amycolatopsis thermoflava TaxID=84480 RepID=UPI00365BCC67
MGAHRMDTATSVAKTTGQSLPPLIPLPTAAQLLGLSRASAYRYAAAGELPVRRLGRRVFVLRSGLAALLEVDESELSAIGTEAA